MSYTVIDSEGRQSVFLAAPQSIPSDSLWHGPSHDVPAQYRISEAAPDFQSFRHAIAQLSAWRSLIATDGRAVELSRCLGEQDLDTAAIWWADLVADGLISDELKADIAQAATVAHMPQHLLDALA